MARTSENDCRPIYNLAEKWKEECLIGEGSLFWPGESVWNENNLKKFKGCFVDNPDDSKESFENKLEKQLAREGDDVTRLACEIMVIYFLFPSNVHQPWKVEVIRRIASWQRIDIDEGHEVFKSFADGIGSGGIAYNTRRPFEVGFIALVALEIVTKTPKARRQVISDHLQLRELFYKIQGESRMQAHHMLLHLLFPDTYERISSGLQKSKISKVFAPLIDQSLQQEDVDDRLFAIRNKLEELLPGEVLDFYRFPLLPYWDASKEYDDITSIPGMPVPTRKDLNIDLMKLKELVDKYIAPHWGVDDDWDLRQGGGETYIQENILRRAQPLLVRDFLEANTKESLVGALKADVNLLSQYERMYALALLDNTPEEDLKEQFVSLIFGDEDLMTRVTNFLEWAKTEPLPEKDTKAGFNGTVGSYILALHDPEKAAFCKPTVYESAVSRFIGKEHIKHEQADRIIHCNRLYEKVFEFLKNEYGLSNGNLFDVHSIFYMLKELGEYGSPEVDIGTAGEAPAEYSMVLSLLKEKKNMVLYGPPGTGKTRSALQLADWWSRHHGPGSVVPITFHPTYSYEDFIEGYRPDPETNTFQLRDGTFKQLCKSAAEYPEKEYLLIIDEINRGDVARVLGELITYLEADKRGERNSVVLQQSGERFFVPENVYVLGTMNTADKSISLMDLAIRRRFLFYFFGPDPDVLDGRAAFWPEVDGVRLSRVLIGLNSRLMGVGIDRDRVIGHSYFLIEKKDPNPLQTLRKRFRYEVIPLVEEYCYSDRSLMSQVLLDMVDADGGVNAELIDDDERFLSTLRALYIKEQ